MSTHCIILAGGLGTRLKCLLPSTPKCLAPIDGFPFLFWQLNYLLNQGIQKFTLSLGYQSNQILDFIGSSLGSKFDIDVVVEPYQLGTGGAINYVMNSLSIDESLVVNGDTIFTGSIHPMFLDLDSSKDELIRIATTQVKEAARYGTVQIDSQSKVTNFLEKGVSNRGIINVGFYRLSKDIFCNVSEDVFSLEEVIFPQYARNGYIYAYNSKGKFIDIGVPEDYTYLNNNIKNFLS